MVAIFQARILFPLRNPKSVAVSYFHHRRKLVLTEYEGSFKGFLPDFIEGMGESLNHILLYPLEASGGYFGLAFATPPPPPRVERFSALTL